MNIHNGNWAGFRELVLVDRKEECPSIVSFFFKSKDGGKLVKHKAGQFLPFKIKTDNPKYKEVMRTYSLSMLPNEDIYRISVRKVDGGLISSYLHEELNVGDTIEAMMPAGIFVPKANTQDVPMVLLSGGIGITPLISMLYAESKARKNITFVQAVQNSSLHPFKNDIEYYAKQNGLKNFVFYSDPLENDKKGSDYDENGFVTKDWLKNNVPLNGEFYFCGPPPFMKGVENSLLELGVPKENIHFESFS